MLEIVSLVDQLAPGLVQRESASVACVCTTRPKFLVFNRYSEHPACVVEFGPRERLARVDGILSQLHPRFPKGVARPIVCKPWHNGTYVQIQEGLGGMPWFRLSDGLATAKDWRAMLDRAVAAMLSLHAATRDVPGWSAPVLAGAELRRQVALCNRDARLLNEPVLERIRAWSQELDAAGPMASCWQHGDFSLNNLLVSDSSVSVIDFDEFGGTLVPLHDAFGLALSVPLSQSESCPLTFPECIAQCVEPARRDERISTGHLPGLLMHHLLWRINQCHGLERRAPLERILLGWVVDLANAPSALGLADVAGG
jgi:Phosphotransferase enzyme family